MGLLSGFWNGAMRFGQGVHLEQLAAEVGGWRQLERSTYERLVALGVSPRRAKGWVSSPRRDSPWTAITLADDTYPERLRRMDSPPPVVMVDGDPGALHGPCVAVVGARNCSPYGRGVSSTLSGRLAEAGVCVVSGLAKGVDRHAHEGAMSGGLTVAVVGHGLGHTSPRSHVALRRKIVAEGGAIISCFPDDLEPRPHTFPIRNQWIAGLSEAVVVVEAGERSGALITARHALEMGRDVFAVPHRLGDPLGKGCLRLLELGAYPLVDSQAFLQRFTETLGSTPNEWLEALFLGKSVAQVSRITRIPVLELVRQLSALELKGQIVRLSDGRYAPATHRAPS